MQNTYSRPKLVNYIVDNLESGKSTAGLSRCVAAYLTDTGKANELDSLMRDAQELRAQKYGVIELTTRSAHTLDAAQVKQIEKVAAGQYDDAKTVKMHKLQDNSVIGGANLTLPHASLDVTIRAKLNQLRESISYETN